ncbi:MAG TPA: cyclopropane-fatty-acyl-phospholipid synthase family protein [Microvirga sp.]|nr:cyclopropane-fatty-acyl-phospholipid synthase family protein [Microvirga sp.]
MTFGNGSQPTVAVRLADDRAIWALLLDPELQLGELFMNERLVVERGSIYDLIELLLENGHGARSLLPVHPLKRLREMKWRLRSGNTAARAKRNASHHYDLDSRLYELFLDADRQYSCAYFEYSDQSLDDAQHAKKRHIAAKLRLESGHRVLDIGSGWGGLALYLAETGGAGDVLGITLSDEQLTTARERAARAGLASRVDFELQDYRAVEGTFDRIVSVGMFEHVGPASYDAFFKACRRLLAEDGVMLLHTIARTGEPCGPNPWVTRYIFPGGHIPTLSEIAPALERSGLMLTDLEVLRLHYAWTLRAWRERFLARRDEALRIYGERFCRMWEFYLASFEVAFRVEDLVVFQLQLAKRNDVLPVRRDYMVEDEAALKAEDSRRRSVAGRATGEDVVR